ncbi:molybdopterin cofactor-binding domain-containing protein [Streptomyces sp. NPDC048309]|uniref:xanthine dehydrogenase family protein molybdopterin-binding subunit n=1 Tax=Streptomyces sp. NPDC048309 TaxID=3154618 RepID=UPI0033E1A997
MVLSTKPRRVSCGTGRSTRMCPGFRPASRHRMALGSGTAGRVSALVYEVRIEKDARYQTYTDGLTDLPQFLYGVPNTRTAYRVTPVDVHSPCSMRGPGVVLGSFALETAMDQLAHELAVDPLELRLRNEPIQDEVSQLPCSTPTLCERYETGARRFGWSRRHVKPGSHTDGDLLICMGMATAGYHNNRRASSARVRILADGTAEVFAATGDMGPGTTTSVMQVVADALGLPASAVTFRLGDSSYPTAPMHAAACSLASVGSAAHTTCDALNGYGAVFAEVSVDPLLGLVRVRRIFAAYDVGRVISPKRAHSQAIGGMVGGIGMALLEGTVTDHRDGRIVNASLADCLVPVNADVPDLDAAFINAEDPQADPIGVKGLGEITIVGVAPAIGNAVFNATGKRLTDLPIRPEALL